MELNFEIKETKDCSSVEINDFFELAKKAEQVDLVGLLDRIKKSQLLAFCRSKSQLVGISAIKVPNNNYKKRIFRKAGIENDVNDYKFEPGYSYTEEKFRGKQISFDLNKELVKELSDNSIFATTANPAMKRILNKIGFTEIGNAYKGKHNTDEIQIFGFRKE